MLKRIKHLSAVLTTLILVLLLSPAALALNVSVDGTAVTEDVAIYNSTTYVPLRAVSSMLCPDASVSWSAGQARVTADSISITATPGSSYITANGRELYAGGGVRLVNQTTLVPVRVLAEAFGAEVYWDSATKSVYVESGSGSVEASSYDSDELYWLSRIIEAESSGEPLNGKIAVGCVILNRVESSEFPDSVYDVIFDDEWGIQFQPVSNGAIYKEPSTDSIVAAKLALDGADVVGNSLYFLNPDIATNFWIVNNRDYITSIGNHDFYS